MEQEYDQTTPAPNAKQPEDKKGKLRARCSSEFLAQARELKTRLVKRSKENAQPLRLLSLRPSYYPAEHEAYLQRLNEVLNDGEIRNIALTGSYGSGKSSILDELERQWNSRWYAKRFWWRLRNWDWGTHAIKLSLSTLCVDASESSGIDEQAGSRGAAADARDNEPEFNKANRIQKELVKQLLYAETPQRMRGSRFQRIVRFRTGKALWGALAASIIATLLVFLFGGFQWAVDLCAAQISAPGYSRCLAPRGIWEAAILLMVMSTVTTYVLIRVTHGPRNLGKLAATAPGVGTLSLESNQTSYFDQYLDEIVHFFEVTGKTVVILEDIDRFGNQSIFEELRALNDLLNRAAQLKPIRFVYAVRDSIFEPEPVSRATDALNNGVVLNGPATVRTKFFDIVIPVVPFITHRNARDLMRAEMNRADADISEELIDLAARHLADMRLIKNIRNEYVTFKAQILEGKRSSLQLDPNILFAMMLYKSTHLSDFEKIKEGTSVLDKIYREHQALIDQNIRRIDKEIQDVQNALTAQDAIRKRIPQLSDQLLKYVGQVQQLLPNNPVVREISCLGITQNDFRSLPEDFWDRYFEERPVMLVILRGNFGRQVDLELRLKYDMVENALGLPASPEVWAEQDRRELANQKAALESEKKFLQSAGFADILVRQNLQYIPPGLENETTFYQVAKALLSPLAFALVEAGFITRDFTVYTTNFYSEAMSATAMNFLMLHIDQGDAGPHYQLSENDVLALLRERPASTFGLPASYNIAILDTLIAGEAVGAMPNRALTVMLRSLAKTEIAANKFLGTYLASGHKAETLVRRLTPLRADILVFVHQSDGIDEQKRITFGSAALESLAERLRYATSAELESWWQDNAGQIPALTQNDIDEGAADRIAELFERAGVALPHIGPPISQHISERLAKRGCLAINRANLIVAGAKDHVPALDDFDHQSPALYNRLLEDLPLYLECLEGEERATKNKHYFIEAMQAATSHSSSDYDCLVDRCDAIIDELSEAPEPLWPALARHKRFPPTVANLLRYLGEDRYFDEDILALLTDSGEIQPENAEVNQRNDLAERLLHVDSGVTDYDLQIRLVTSLNLETTLDPAIVADRSGDLAGHLIKHAILADTAATFAALHNVNWDTREFAIKNSQHFEEFVAPGLIPTDQIRQALQSDQISAGIKEKILYSLEEFAADANPETCQALARYARQENARLSESQLALLAQRGAGAAHVIPLMAPHLQKWGFEAMQPIIAGLPEPYSGLARKSGEKLMLKLSTPDLEPLLERLKALGVVTYKRRNMVRDIVNVTMATM